MRLRSPRRCQLQWAQLDTMSANQLVALVLAGQPRLQACFERSQPSSIRDEVGPSVLGFRSEAPEF